MLASSGSGVLLPGWLQLTRLAINTYSLGSPMAAIGPPKIERHSLWLLLDLGKMLLKAGR
jgi:hypothetical protein